MKSRYRLRHWVAACLLPSVLSLQIGCFDIGFGGSAGFLGLEDYQRDLVLGGLAAAILVNLRNGNNEPGAGQGVPGEDGADGINCWDLDGDGEDDPDEDVNGDEAFTAADCVGPAGPAGTDGTDGEAGSPGPTGATGSQGPAGPKGDDGDRGAEGPEGDDGPRGPQGAQGDPGPAGADGSDVGTFYVFIDDFFSDRFANPPGATGIEVGMVMIKEPFLIMQGPNAKATIAFRFPIAVTYDPGNDLTMRIFLVRASTTQTAQGEDPCFVIRVEASILRAGEGITQYGPPRWVQPSPPAGDGLTVIDLPINSTAGLDYPAVEDRDFLAFALTAVPPSDSTEIFQLLGVEIFESLPDSAELDGAIIASAVPASCDSGE